MNKETLRRGITALGSLLPLRRRVLLESSPDLSCNVYPVFRAMLDDPAFADVELTWLVQDSRLWRDRYPQKNVSFVDYHPDDRAQRIRAVRLALSSRCVLFCNKTIWAPRRGQLSLFLGHGTPIKSCRGFYSPGRFCNRWSYPSARVRSVMEQELALVPEQGLPLGYPRCDALTNPCGALDKVIDRAGKKVIFWLPTFRQHAKHYDSNYTLPGCGLPLLEEPGALERLNARLEEAGVLLVLKPHPVQDMSAIRAGALSAFRLLSDEDLRKADVRLYEVLADADALLTDYSSVYCDFLLTGRPIGLTFDDLEQYRHSRGLVAEDIRTLVKGRYLYTLADLVAFVGEIARGEDPARAERAAACDYYNDFKDGQSARRVAQTLLTFLNEGAI